MKLNNKNKINKKYFLSDFDYDLPKHLIAQKPLNKRNNSRLLVVYKKNGKIEHKKFSQITNFIKEGDLWVFNNSKVVPARFFSDDKKFELLCLEKITEKKWHCLTKPAKKLKLGKEFFINKNKAIVKEILPQGERIIEFFNNKNLEIVGQLALPPYIQRTPEISDSRRYQTIFANSKSFGGSIAAPTAGLHFTKQEMSKIPHEFLTLHVGVGTFRPVTCEDISKHIMHAENCNISKLLEKKMNTVCRIVAVGTTTVRSLEFVKQQFGKIQAGDFKPDNFIFPPYKFVSIDCLLTNFHLPKSTLLMLVCAFAGRDLIFKAYKEAIAREYRFFSYGDCMLIMP